MLDASLVALGKNQEGKILWQSKLPTLNAHSSDTTHVSRNGTNNVSIPHISGFVMFYFLNMTSNVTFYMLS
jgi:hypothetical protein